MYMYDISEKNTKKIPRYLRKIDLTFNPFNGRMISKKERYIYYIDETDI